MGFSAGERGRKGTLKQTSDLTRSGLISPSCQATSAPQSCPTTKAYSVLTPITQFNSTERFQNNKNKKERENSRSWKVADLFSVEGVEEADEIAEEMEDRIGEGIGGRIGVSVPSHVGRYHVVAVVGDSDHLVPPREPELWKAMEQNNQRSRRWPDLCHVHLDAICPDPTVPVLLYRM